MKKPKNGAIVKVYDEIGIIQDSGRYSEFNYFQIELFIVHKKPGRVYGHFSVLPFIDLKNFWDQIEYYDETFTNS